MARYNIAPSGGSLLKVWVNAQVAVDESGANFRLGYTGRLTAGIELRIGLYSYYIHNTASNHAAEAQPGAGNKIYTRDVGNVAIRKWKLEDAGQGYSPSSSLCAV